MSGRGGIISNVKVTLLHVRHTNPDDLDVLLVSPSGHKVLLMSDAGGTHDIADRTFTFSDTAGGSLSNSGRLGSGTFRPTNYDTTTDKLAAPAPAAPFSKTLTALNGQSPNGSWKLFVRDDRSSNSGSIAGGWSVTITTVAGP